MYLSLNKSFKKIINSSNIRTANVKKNIIISIFIKGFNVLTNLVLVPLTLNFVTPSEYGIWITLSSIIGWFSFFDIGFGNGLRNRFAEAVSNGKYKLARIYVSTTYAILLILSAILISVFFNSNLFLNWNEILNCYDISNRRLSNVVTVTFLFFCFQFILQLISTILTANHEPAKSSFISFIGNVIILGCIFVVNKFSKGGLIELAFILGLIPVVTLFLASIYLFKTKYKKYSPSFKLIQFKHTKYLMRIGIKFFVIQIAFIVLYQTNNLIIIQKFGPEAVTPFNISYKYFFIIPMFFNIISLPLWSAYTDAWVKNDTVWIQTIMKKLHKIFVIILIITIIMIFSSSYIYPMWIGKPIKIPFLLSLNMGIYIVFNIWNSIYSQFLNGVGKVQLQLIVSILGSIINIPLAVYLCHQLGIYGTILSTTIISVFCAVIFPIQFKKLINKKATGIWNA